MCDEGLDSSSDLPPWPSLPIAPGTEWSIVSTAMGLAPRPAPRPPHTHAWCRYSGGKVFPPRPRPYSLSRSLEELLFGDEEEDE